MVAEEIADAHALEPEGVARALGTDSSGGLGREEAKGRLERHGPNLPEERHRPRYLELAARQLLDPLVALLLAAAVVSLAIGEEVDAIVIGVIVVLNGTLGFSQELGAERAVIALRGAMQSPARVIRDGREQMLAAADLVPGDLFVVAEGDRIPADGRIVRGQGLAVDEAPLTGESTPEEKSGAAVPVETPLADRTSILYGGTAVTRGWGTAIVTATGRGSEIGRLAEMAGAAKPPMTPLQQRLRGLTGAMVGVGIAVTALLAGLLLVRGASLDEAFLLGVSVAVAAVPEGLAATVTVALALGARRMAARGAIVRRLPAVETLGSATTIACDKTGTLTVNRLRLDAVAPAAGCEEGDVLRAAALASTARFVEGEQGEVAVAGDPVDRALVLAARERGLDLEDGIKDSAVVRELPFDPERKRMTLVYRRDGVTTAFSKGAPEVLLSGARIEAGERRALADRAEAWAAQGLRVLAVGSRELDGCEQLDGEIEREERLIGLVALRDPLRKTAPAAIQSARDAGLDVAILTGDHRATAAAVAAELGLPQDAVRARVTPAEKLRVVEDLQRSGEVVAVTGDGVNDAPALRRGDVGVAMGRSGTEAAREAADLVLTDDDFATIVAAIREGRAISDNIRKFVAFLLSANLGEVLLFAVAVAAGFGAPMSVVQVLLVNVLTDGLPAVALAFDPPAPGLMRRPPERRRALFGREGRIALVLVGVMVGAVALAAFLIGREMEGGEAAQTMAFATLAAAELAVVFSVRSPLRPAWREPRNPLLLGAVAVSAGVLLLTMWPFREPFGTASLNAPQVVLVVLLALLPAATIEVGKKTARSRRR